MNRSNVRLGRLRAWRALLVVVCTLVANGLVARICVEPRMEPTVRLDADLQLLTNSPGFAEYVRKSGLTQHLLNQFLEALARFRRDSAFDAFFTNHAPYV